MFSFRAWGSTHHFFKGFNIRYLHETHYEVLNLKRDCSHRDIKRSFIELSKKYHPDRAKDDNARISFVRILDAYSVLSRPGSRADYDLGLRRSDNVTPYRNVYHHGQSSPWSDPSFYQNRDKSKDFENERKPFYGVKGITKKSNTVIVVFCVFFITIGSILQTIAILGSYRYGREQLENKSKAIGEALAEVRAEATANGNKLQLQLLADKMNNKNKTSQHLRHVIVDPVD